jgi:hypothetical protein
MDTILNLVIVQFLMNKKGDVHWLCASPIGGKGRRTLATRVSHKKQERWFIQGHASHLPNSIKKKANRIFFMGYTLHQPAMVPVATHTYSYV